MGDVRHRDASNGKPFTVALLSEIDNSGTGRSILGFGANDRPNLVGNPELSDRQLQWFNTAAFAFPPPGTLEMRAGIFGRSRISERERFAAEEHENY